MASLCLSATATALGFTIPPSSSTTSTSSSTSLNNFRCYLSFPSNHTIQHRKLCLSKVGMLSRRSHVVCMAPEEEKMTRRSPLDFPIEWERPKPGRRPDIFPQFSPMKTPLPPPMPADPPEEDEDEEEKKEEDEEDPDKEEQDNPDK
ncbi:uncharacterized protein LOC141599765 [Silene latifolia]|uniref:uncharacterized protein LOC141599765 n=1 Tax=Silene latifolia TaxID=37657 RepID=UPI003D7764EF